MSASDKSEGSVKGILILGGARAPLGSPERLRTKTLEISPESLSGGTRSTNHRFGLSIDYGHPGLLSMRTISGDAIWVRGIQ
jgi:hypothetical protein